MKRPFVPGVVLNALALVGIAAAAPGYGMALVLLLVGAVLGGGSLLTLGCMLAFGLMALGPLVGLPLALLDIGRRFTLVAGALSAVTTAAVAYGLNAYQLKNVGRCHPLTNDASQIGRECSQSKMDDCPAYYSCVERVVNVDTSWECAIMCQDACECPAGHGCIGSKCKPN